MSGDAKVPSVLYYDENNVPILHGAETEDEVSQIVSVVSMKLLSVR